jgi:hypothetical protein
LEILEPVQTTPLRSELRQLSAAQRSRIRIVAPTQLQGAVQIIDYGVPDGRRLIEQGLKDAAAKLKSNPFPPS